MWNNEGICSCLTRPFLFMGANPVTYPACTVCGQEDRQRILQNISAAWHAVTPRHCALDLPASQCTVVT